MTATHTEKRIITAKAFRELLGIKPTAFYNWQNPKHTQHKPNFPKPFPLGGRLNGYDADEVNQFIESLINQPRKVRMGA